MTSMGDYSGHVAAVDIDLWRGAYTLVGLEVNKASSDVPVPFLHVDRLDLAVSWADLLRGRIVADLGFHSPQLNFVDDTQHGAQTGSGTDWQQALQQLVPIEIDQLTIHQGAIHFRNFNSTPAINLVISDLDGVVVNLSNADRGEGAKYANMAIDGEMLGDAQVSIKGQLDPLGDFQDFTLKVKISGVDLPELNSLTRVYGGFDFESGYADFLLELTAAQGKLQGYAKPLLDQVDILELDQDLDEGPLNASWEALVAALGQIFRNQPEDRIASQIEIRGDLKQQDISAWQAFVSILRNAFVEAYEATFKRETN